MNGPGAAARDEPPAAPRPFEIALEQHTRRRHSLILAGAEQLLPPPVRGFSPEDVLNLPGGRGYLPLRDAARQMGLSEHETIEWVGRGLLEALDAGGALLVRPAIVSTLAVTH